MYVDGEEDDNDSLLGIVITYDDIMVFSEEGIAYPKDSRKVRNMTSRSC